MLWVFYLYLGIGVLAFIGLVLSFIFGGIAAIDFDVDIDIPGIDVDVGGPDFDVGGGPGLFSLPVILGFFASFGSLGAILTYYGMHPAVTPFISSIVAFIIAGILFMIITWMFKHFQSDSTVSYPKLVGSEASVSIPIFKGKEGQVVLFTEQRGRTLVPAISDEVISENTKVIITEVIGDSVRVRKKKSNDPAGRSKKKR